MKESKSLAAHIFAATLLLLLLHGLSHNTLAAPGDVDLSFDTGTGVNGPVNALVVQSDGKVIIAGSFTAVKGLARRNIARLNADGSGDSSFTPGPPFTNPATIYALALQSDGKVLVGQDNDANYGITRLNADGSYDTNFNSNAYAAIASTNPVYSFRVTALLVQPDGKVLYGGEKLLRLNSNGTLDTNFHSGAIGYVYAMARQPDGKLIVGGYFYVDYVGGSPIGYGLARLNTDGSRDNTFDQAAGSGGLFHSIVLQPDGKVLVGGSFIGTNSACIRRLNGNGTVDSTFAEVTGNGPGGRPETKAIGLQSDGKVLIGGTFSPINGYPRTNLARLNANGSVDRSFTNDAAGSFDASVQAISIQTDGSAFIGGSFSTLSPERFRGSSVARLRAEGSVHVGFQPGRRAVDGPIARLSLLSDGKTLAGGLVTFQNGSNQYATVRLNADGSRDDTFSSATFTPDVGFINSADEDNVWTCLEVQPNGNVLVGGYTLDYYDCDETGCLWQQLQFLHRVHSNGTRDFSFNPTVGIPTAIAVQPDGRVLAAWYRRIARLNTNGSTDGTFAAVDVTQTLNGEVRDFEIQPDGKILVGGSFSKINGTNRNGIARLNANGTLDTTFNPGTGADGDVRDIALQSDGKVVIGGAFTHFNGVARNRIARLNSNGSIDSSFNAATDGGVSSIMLQPDGNILIGGDFLTVNGVLRPYVARLYGDFARPALNIGRSNSFVIVSWPAAFSNFQLQENTNLSVSNGWSSIVAARSTNDGFISVIRPATNSHQFFRLSSF